eukprot:XP_001695558.1 predicted protein [Chlamydomonas reinhardtii]
MAMESESGRPSGALGDGSTMFGTVLVSGATGFVGFHVVQTLLAHSGVNQVRCLTRKPTPDLEELAAVSGGRVQLCLGDLGTVESCRSSVAPHLADVDGVINCAAHYRWWTKSPNQFRRLNAEAAGELAALSRQAGVRQVPATLGHETTFTYIGVRDAAAAIVAALHRGKTGRRYLIGNQRMATDEYYNLIARLSGTPPPRPVVPVWLAAGWAQAAAALATLTGVPPQAPPDLIRTVAYGTLLYDSGCSEAELGLALPYRDIAASFQEAVECVKRHDAQRVAGARP